MKKWGRPQAELMNEEARLKLSYETAMAENDGSSPTHSRAERSGGDT